MYIANQKAHPLEILNGFSEDFTLFICVLDVDDDIFLRLYIPVPGMLMFIYVPFGPKVILAPLGPTVVLIPFLLILMYTPGAIFFLLLKFQAIVLLFTIS